MVVTCEECGKKYQVDPAKIKGKAASFKCHVCSHVIMVLKEQVTIPQPDFKINERPTATTANRLAANGADPKVATPTIDKVDAATRHRRKAEGLGLRTKMLLLFLFIPLILMAGTSLFYLWYFETHARLLVRQSSKIVTQLAEGEIANISAATAIMQSQAKALTDKARMIALIVLGATLLLIGIIVFVYSHRLTGKIKSLTDIAERISVGELEMEIVTKSSDEIGKLAEAISRMQDNIRLSIERLRRRQ